MDISDDKSEDKITSASRTENETILESCIEKLVIDESKTEAVDGNEAAGDAVDGNEAAGDAVDGNEAAGGAVDGNEAAGGTNTTLGIDDNAEGIIDCTGIRSESVKFFKTLDRCAYFANNTYHYLKDCYDDFKQGRKGTQEKSVKLPFTCGPPYTEALYRYDPSKGYQKYLEFAHYENRSEKLTDIFETKMINLGNNKLDWQFLHYAAFFFLAAFDLKENAGFEDAPQCAKIAFTRALFSTDQVQIVDDWLGSESESGDSN